MTIESRLIDQYLPENRAVKISVVCPLTGLNALVVSAQEALALARERVVVGEVSKHGRLRYLRLTASARAARRILGRKLPASIGHRVSHLRTPKGAKRWKPRLDQAQTGIVGSHRAVWFPT